MLIFPDTFGKHVCHIYTLALNNNPTSYSILIQSPAWDDECSQTWQELFIQDLPFSVLILTLAAWVWTCHQCLILPGANQCEIFTTMVVSNWSSHCLMLPHWSVVIMYCHTIVSLFLEMDMHIGFPIKLWCVSQPVPPGYDYLRVRGQGVLMWTQSDH